MDNSYMELAQIFQQLRKKYNLTQEEMAYKCELQSGYISKIERGTHNPNLETIKKIAGSFEMSVVEMLSLNEEFLRKPEADPITIKITSIVQNLPEETKEQILKITKTFVK